ncbi:hypothetical protein ACIF9R_37295 [Streptomyces sp. NPDC086080]|uniref:hypothetical protein n=1 Tax=Streptomyces sp. NPDC086080 TaxID=3365748 RepID=UPI0037D7CDC0
MVDPISTASTSAAKALASILTKRLQSRVTVRLGSRDERRQVYARFQEASAEALTAYLAAAAQHQLHTVWLFGHRVPLTYRPWAAYRETSRSVDKLTEVYGRLFAAYYELRLVANPGPLEAAQALLQRLDGHNMILPDWTTDQDRLLIAGRVLAAQNTFTDVCRDDLWYLPKRWQVYRLAWWKARRWRRNNPA